MPIAGGPATTLASNTVGGRVVAVLDGMVFWDSGGYENQNAEISSVALDGGAPGTFEPLEGGGFYQVPTILAWQGSVFFDLEGVGIESESPYGGTPALLSSADGQFAMDDANFYVSDQTGIEKISRTTGAATVLVPAPDPSTSSITSIAVDATDVYWTNEYGITQSSVARVPIAGGPVTVLATNQDDTSSIVLDSTSAYWIAGQLLQKVHK